MPAEAAVSLREVTRETMRVITGVNPAASPASADTGVHL
jgi:hypothetical protein